MEKQQTPQVSAALLTVNPESIVQAVQTLKVEALKTAGPFSTHSVAGVKPVNGGLALSGLPALAPQGGIPAVITSQSAVDSNHHQVLNIPLAFTSTSSDYHPIALSALSAFQNGGELQAATRTSSALSSQISMSPGTSPIAPSANNSRPVNSSPPKSERVKVLLSSGGRFIRSKSSGSWEYDGGETRLLAVNRGNNYHELLQQLARSSATSVWDQTCRLMYQLPGNESTILVDLIDDEDVENMWEEWESYCEAEGKKTYKMHIYVQDETEPSSSANVSGGTGHSEPQAHTPSVVEGDNKYPSTGSAVSELTMAGEQDWKEYVSHAPRVNLLDLEAKLEIIMPDQLQIMRMLGSGGFGEVYLARWHSSEVAVKCLNPSLLIQDHYGSGGLVVSQEVVAELLKEANTLAGLRHPNVVWVYGIVLPPVERVEALKDRLGPGQGIDAVNVAANAANAMPMVPGMIRPPALVTEYLAGGSIRNALARKAEFMKNASVKLKLALDTARGMEYLHKKKIVHFDLKTGNLLVGFREKTPCCKVADFGLSKQKHNTFITGVTSLRGTLPWTAPEIILTPKTVTEKVDVYSFGIVLWELWTGKEPYEGINYHALLHMISTSGGNSRPPLPGTPQWEEFYPEEPCDPEPIAGWSALMQQCWAEDPSERPNFSKVLSALEEMLAQLKFNKRRATSA